MNQPSDILFQVISNLTGGLIVDLQTAMVGMLTVAFLLMGLDYLKDVLDNKLHQRNVDSSLRDAQKYKDLSSKALTDVERDYYNAKYRNIIRSAAR